MTDRKGVFSVTRRGQSEDGETRSQRHRRRQREEEEAAWAALARLAADGQLDRLVDDPEELEALQKFLGRKG
jgi:hypothetical protein